jgi:hypothetical protein
MLVIIYSLVEKGRSLPLLPLSTFFGGNIMDLITWGRPFKHPALLSVKLPDPRLQYIAG